MTSRFVLPILLSLACAGASAQPFQDLPPDHWSRSALENLYSKVLVGSPEGAFRGDSLASRYELAAALHRLLQIHLDSVSSNETQIGAKSRSVSQPQGQAPSLQPLADRLNALEASQLRLLLSEFEKELVSLGMDAKSLQSTLEDLRSRIVRLEDSPQKIRVSGESTLAVIGAISSQNKGVMASSGHILGFDSNGNGRGFEKNSLVLHEFSFNFSGAISKNADFEGRLSAGNALPVFRGLAGDSQGRLQPSQSDLYIQSLNASLHGSQLRGKSKLTLGRYGHSVPLIFEKVSNTPFWKNESWDSSLYPVDGFKLAMTWPGSELDIFGGKTVSVRSFNGTELSAPVIRSFTTRILESDSLLGASLSLQANPFVSFHGGMIYIDGSRTIGAFPYSVNRMITLGGSTRITLPSNIKVEGGVAKNIYKEGSRTTVDNRNETFFAKLIMHIGSLSLEGEHRRREHNSSLNADWGHLGAVINPTGYTSYKGTLSLPTKFGRLSIGAEDAEGLSRDRDIVGTAGLDQGDRLFSLSINAEARLGNNWLAEISYSSAQWNLAKRDDPRQSFLTLKANGALDARSTFGFGLQFAESDAKNAPFLMNQSLGGSFKGTVFFCQASVKF